MPLPSFYTTRRVDEANGLRTITEFTYNRYNKTLVKEERTTDQRIPNTERQGQITANSTITYTYPQYCPHVLTKTTEEYRLVPVSTEGNADPAKAKSVLYGLRLMSKEVEENEWVSTTAGGQLRFFLAGRIRTRLETKAYGSARQNSAVKIIDFDYSRTNAVREVETWSYLDSGQWHYTWFKSELVGSYLFFEAERKERLKALFFSAMIDNKSSISDESAPMVECAGGSGRGGGTNAEPDPPDPDNDIPDFGDPNDPDYEEPTPVIENEDDLPDTDGPPIIDVGDPLDDPIDVDNPLIEDCPCPDGRAKELADDIAEHVQDTLRPTSMRLTQIGRMLRLTSLPQGGDIQQISLGRTGDEAWSIQIVRESNGAPGMLPIFEE
ncbi:MAG: hypothetical protein ACRC1W_03750 [Shewanella sp.]